MNRKIVAVLLAIAMLTPVFKPGRAAVETKITLLSPRTNAESAFLSILVLDKEIKKGDSIKISFAATETTELPEMKEPGCDYAPFQNRRFNPGPKFFDKCKENTYAKEYAKMYLAEWQGESVKLQQVSDFQDKFIPGFLLPPLPIKTEDMNKRLNLIFGSIQVSGFQCSFENGSKLVNALSERSITIKSPADFTIEEAKKGITISIPEQFGIICPATAGAYSLEISSGSSGTIKQTAKIFAPIIGTPTFTISNTFPDELSNYTFSFTTSGAGALLAGQSNVKLMLNKGFIAKQEGKPWKAFFNENEISSSNIRTQTSSDFDTLYIQTPLNISAESAVKIVFMGVTNPSETGIIKCFGQTSSDTILTEFNSQEIKYEQLATSTPPDSGVKAVLSIRFVSPGIFEGEETMITLPEGASFSKDATLAINNKEYKRVSFGEKTAQFVMPEGIEKGKFVKMTISYVINPPQESSIQLKTSSASLDIKWRISEYSPKFTAKCTPPIANMEASWEFEITPPENLAADERKEIIINGCFNRILKPATNVLELIVNGNPMKASFANDSIKISFSEPFPSKKTIRIEMPKNLGFGTPDQACEFKAILGQETLTSNLALKDSPPIVHMKITDMEGKPAIINEFGWFNKPLKLIFESSSGKANIVVQGLEETFTSNGKDFEIEIKQPVLAKKLKYYATDERGSSSEIFNPIMVDMEQPEFKIVSEETSPMQTYKVILEVNRKIVPVPDTKQFLVIEPTLTIQSVVMPMKVDLVEEKPAPSFTATADVNLQIGANNIELVATDQAGNKVSKNLKVQFDYEEINFSFDTKQETTLAQGLQTVKFVANPESIVAIGDKKNQANSKGEVSFMLNINAGFNYYDATITTKKGAQQTYTIILNGKRIIKMKIGVAQFDIDGKTQALKVAPMNNFKSEPKIPNYYNGITFVPLKDLATALFCTVTYDEKTKMVSIVQKRPQGERIIKVKLGYPNAFIDGKEIPLQPGKLVSPVVIKGTSMVPLRFIAENLGSVVGFDKASNSITVSWPDVQKAPTPEIVKIK